MRKVKRSCKILIMSGHSKWSKVKHQKEATDAVKGKIFTKMASAIIIAVKDGGGLDPTSNFKLRLAIDKAKSVNMPKENISRAIERAGKSGNNTEMSEIIYEAFGPSGIGLLIKSITDNKQRTVSELKNILERNGGVLGGAGSVAHLFSLVGLIEIEKNGQNMDELMEKAIDAGAVDFEENPDLLIIYTNHSDLHKVREKLSGQDVNISVAELYYRPLSLIPVIDNHQIEKIDHLITTIEEREDVLKVFSNLQAGDNV